MPLKCTMLFEFAEQSRASQAWEIHEALKVMRLATAPGQDGLTVAFYKEFKDLLVPHLVTLFEEISESGEMPPTMREALIVAILKPGKPAHECSSFRPLSLLNVDTKLYGKVLANRLAPLVLKLASTEQAGFVPGRNLTYNLHTFFGTVQHTNPEVKGAAVFFWMQKKPFILWSGHL